MTNFNDRIERLAELDGKASNANWEIGLASKFICSRDKDTGIFHCVGDINTIDDSRFICALRNEALPLLREMAQALSEARAENERLRARQANLKETLLPVCEYAAEIYYRGTPAIPMPDDTIQRLNWAFKMFGG